MQFRGYHINNLKSYRKYFCFLDAVDALENGAYGEWLAALSETMRGKEAAVSEDGRMIEEIRLLLEQRFEGGTIAGRSECACCEKTHETEAHDRITYDGKICGEKAEYGKETEYSRKVDHDEESYRRLFLLFYKLAHLPVTDGDMEEINRLARSEAEKRKKGQACEEERTDSGRETLLTEKEYKLPVWKREEDHQPFVWEKIVNKGSFPVTIRIINKEEYHCINPGGFAWMLTRNGGFVRWGRRVQVDQRSFACVDRKGCLVVDGYSMQGAGMVDFSFDHQTGILGVDKDGGLRQYSALELHGEAGSEGRLVFAGLKGKTYVLVREDGALTTNLITDAGASTDIFNCQETEGKLCLEKAFCEEEVFLRKSAAKELPFQAVVISVSDQLIGFETLNSRVGVWDREQERVIWTEESEWDKMQ